MILREIYVKHILSKSKVFDYALNPYVGCQHGCTYCYARFIKRFTGHTELWGEFVDIKINAPALLKSELAKMPTGRVWVSGVCDPYQPLEEKYKLTRMCLELLSERDWPVTIQTKSPLVLRDIDLLRRSNKVEVGFSIATADNEIRKLFEPNAPPIQERLRALEELRLAGIKTFTMIAPMLPGAERLPDALKGKIDYGLIDKMNYHYGDWVYKKHNLESAMDYGFFSVKSRELACAFQKQGVECQVLF